MRKKEKRVAAIILAGGSGSRFSSEITKQKYEILGKTVLYRATEAFEKSPLIDDIIVVCREGEFEFAAAQTAGFVKLRAVVVGGEYRAESAKRGFLALGGGYSGTVLIHDGARCLISDSDIEKIVRATEENPAVTAARPITDTVKLVDDMTIIKTLSRDNIVTVQTPQAFDADLYAQALDAATLSPTITDDNMLLETIGVRAACVITSAENIKITTPEDVRYAEYIIGKREGTL